MTAPWRIPTRSLGRLSLTTYCREARPWWYGRGVQGRGHPAAPQWGAEMPARNGCEGCAVVGAFSTRGAGGVGTEPSEYLHDLRHWRAGRPAIHCDGVPRWRNAEAPNFRQTACT